MRHIPQLTNGTESSCEKEKEYKDEKRRAETIFKARKFPYTHSLTHSRDCDKLCKGYICYCKSQTFQHTKKLLKIQQFDLACFLNIFVN